MVRKRLSAWERKIYRQVEQQGTDQELREHYKHLDILADIKTKRFERTGHVVRIDQGRKV